MKRISLLMLVTALAASMAFAQAKEQKAKAPGAGESAEQQLMKLEHEWADAFLHGDAAAVERIEAAGFVFTDPDGKVNGKAEDLADLKSSAYKLESANIENLKVRLYGDTAVVTGHNVMKGTYKGKDLSGTYAFTDTFIKRGGRWEAVASQVTKIK